MWNAKKDFINLRKQKHQSVQEYYERFVALKEVNETLNTNVHDDLGFIDAIARENGEDPSSLTETQKTDYMEQGRERMLDIHMLMGADKARFESAWVDLERANLMDQKNRYPKNIHECYTLLKG